jgi:hypothetical protein
MSANIIGGICCSYELTPLSAKHSSLAFTLASPVLIPVSFCRSLYRTFFRKDLHPPRWQLHNKQQVYHLNFATLALENSEDPGSKDRGGDYVFGKGQMYPDFEATAFVLNPGQITETPLLTRAGYHIIKLEEKFAKDQPISLKCSKDYYEFGINFVKYKINMGKITELEKDPKYEMVINHDVYDTVESI